MLKRHDFGAFIIFFAISWSKNSQILVFSINCYWFTKYLVLLAYDAVMPPCLAIVFTAAPRTIYRSVSFLEMSLDWSAFSNSLHEKTVTFIQVILNVGSVNPQQTEMCVSLRCKKWKWKLICKLIFLATGFRLFKTSCFASEGIVLNQPPLTVYFSVCKTPLYYYSMTFRDKLKERKRKK